MDFCVVHGGFIGARSGYQINCAVGEPFLAVPRPGTTGVCSLRQSRSKTALGEMNATLQDRWGLFLVEQQGVAHLNVAGAVLCGGEPERARNPNAVVNPNTVADPNTIANPNAVANQNGVGNLNAVAIRRCGAIITVALKPT